MKVISCKAVPNFRYNGSSYFNFEIIKPIKSLQVDEPPEFTNPWNYFQNFLGGHNPSLPPIRFQKLSSFFQMGKIRFLHNNEGRHNISYGDKCFSRSLQTNVS